LIRRRTLRDLGLWRKPLTSVNLYCHLDRNSWHRYGALVCCLSQPGTTHLLHLAVILLQRSSGFLTLLTNLFLHPPILKKLEKLSCCDCVVNQTLVVISFLTFSPQPIYTNWCLSKALLPGGDRLKAQKLQNVILKSDNKVRASQR
jgi:hypothetical protein